MAQTLAIVGQQIYLYLHTPMYNGQYRFGQYISFPSYNDAQMFLQAAPECVRMGSGRYERNAVVYDVYAATGCYAPPPPMPAPYCPCARNQGRGRRY